MAVNWRQEHSAPVAVSLKWQITLALLAGVLLILLVSLLECGLEDTRTDKVRANQIVSPWDRSQIPPVLRPSHVVATAQRVGSERDSEAHKREVSRR